MCEQLKLAHLIFVDDSVIFFEGELGYVTWGH